MADIYSLTIRADTRDVTRAKQALEGLSSGAIRATRTTDKLAISNQRVARTSKRMSGAFRVQKGAIQQAGFQIGDFATQVSAGQSAMVAFGQQASQLAGVMGPGGAVLGAVIAIGAGIAGAFINSMSQGEEATKDLTEKMRQLAIELGHVSDRQRDIINTGYAQTIAEQTREIEKQRASIFEANRVAETFFNNQIRAGVPAAVIESSEAWKNLIAPVEDAKNEIASAKQIIDATKLAQKEFWKELDNTGDSAGDAAEKVRDMVAAAEEQAATMHMSARAMATYEAALAGATPEQILAIDTAYRRIEAEQALQAELKRTADREAAAQKALMESTKIGVEDDPLLQRIEAEKRGQEILLQQQKDYVTARQSLDQNMLAAASGTAQQLASVIGQMAGENSDAYRAAFLAQQAFAVATSIVNTQMAAAAALAPPPVGLGPVAGAPYAAAIEGLGMANVAIIAAQTVAGLGQSYSGARQMGGSVSGGSSYLVGENGPEIVTMGGSGVVTPSSVTNQGSTNVTQVFQLSDNARREAKQAVLESAPFIRQQAKAAVLEAIGQGGSMSRAVGRRS